MLLARRLPSVLLACVHLYGWKVNDSSHQQVKNALRTRCEVEQAGGPGLDDQDTADFARLRAWLESETH